MGSGCGGEEKSGAEKPRVEASEKEGSLPDILLITVDTLRADHLGAYGALAPGISPAIDRLAGEGVLFERAYAPASWTAPSMVSLMTSLPPAVHGIVHGQLERTPLWKRWVPGTDARVVYQEILPEVAVTLAETLAGAGYTTAGITTNGHLVANVGFTQGFDWYDETSCLWGRAACVNERVEQLLQEGLPRPFFLWVHYFDPHHDDGPSDRRYDPPPPYDQAYPWKGEPKGREQSVALYDGEVQYTDHAIAALRKNLEQRGLWEGLVVAFTSDHGDELLDHGSFHHTWTLYEELIHVPLILRFPGRGSARRVGEVISLLDVAPTILAQVGVDVPPAMEGRSLLPFVDGKPRVGEPPPVYAETRRWTGLDLQTVVRGDSNLIWDRAGQRFELYDLALDPGEKENLAASRPEEREELERLLAGHLADAEARALPVRVAEEVDAARLEKLRSLGYIR